MKTISLIITGLFLVSLTTPRSWATAPSATTQAAVNLTAKSATLTAAINPNGITTSAYFEYGATTSYGSTTGSTNTGSGHASVTVSNTVTALVPGASYHYRAVATSSGGTSYGGDLTLTAPVFTPTNSALPGIASGSVGLGDFNNTGKFSLLLTGTDGSFNPSSQAWQNQGSYSFSNISTGLSGLPAVTSSSVAWADFANNGYPGFVLTGYEGLGANDLPIYVSQVWRNQGNGTFVNTSASLPGVGDGAVAWSDFYGDGNLDILLTGSSGSGPITQIWRNEGNGTFTNVNVTLPGVFYSAVAVGDFYNDGNEDILLTGTTNGFSTGAITELWRNLGNGTFVNANVALPAVYRGAVATGDFFNDGMLDILLTGYSSTGLVAEVWRNLGNGTFTQINTGLPGVYESSVAVGDYDNDGNLDILLSGVDAQTNAICQVWRNLGGGIFTNINTSLPGIQSGSVIWADLNNDGKLDILLTGYDTNNNPMTQIYYNNLSATNSLKPQLESPVVSADGVVRVSFQGKTGEPYRIWTSTNAVQWSVAGAPHESSTGTFQFYDHASVPSVVRLYQASAP